MKDTRPPFSTLLQEAGWASGPIWIGAENLARNRVRFPDRPGRSVSLYRLRYPGRRLFV